MGIIPDSHNGPLYDLYDNDGNWTGNIRDAEVPKLGMERAVYLGGPAGSITAHNCRCVHGSPPTIVQTAAIAVMRLFCGSRLAHYGSYQGWQIRRNNAAW